MNDTDPYLTQLTQIIKQVIDKDGPVPEEIALAIRAKGWLPVFGVGSTTEKYTSVGIW